MNARNRPGQTLIEVVMATMISAMTTTAVFSVILSSFVSAAKADKRDAAAMVLKRAQETLKNYVSADPTSAHMFPGTATPRPGSAGSPTGHWPAEPGNTFWALREGNHDISSLVNNANNPVLSPNGSPAATLTYNVSSYPCSIFNTWSPPNNQALCKRVVFTLNYTE